MLELKNKKLKSALNKTKDLLLSIQDGMDYQAELELLHKQTLSMLEFVKLTKCNKNAKNHNLRS